MYDEKEIKLFSELFKARTDIFAIRWEKDNKNGYSPSYQYDPYQYKLHRIKGGNFQNYQDKSHTPLTKEQIIEHLNGEKFIGIYPLLKDNTSCFIAADFDKENWIEECRTFLNTCKSNNIPAYLERSRSGNGGHIWVFFEQPYPANRSRKIIKTLLEETGLFSLFDKSSSFDRLFPNQDSLSGKGFGNLIALPLNKQSLEKGNCCFIDVETLQPYNNQWEFLKSICRISISELDKLYNRITNKETSIISNQTQAVSGKLSIRLNSSVCVSRAGLPMPLINFLKEEFNFFNTEYIIKKNIGKNTFGTERYFKFIEEKENDITIPRGAIGRLLRYCRDNQIENDFIDERKKHNNISFSCNVNLRDHQKSALEATSKKDIGVIVAPPGSGKTIIGLKIIAEKQQPALIIVHRKQLADQWIERIQTFLGIPKNEIGKIGQGKTKIGKKLL
jgi:hypothetical protein